jgi:hypothetical protein
MEPAPAASAKRAANVSRPPRLRSRVTNGSTPFVEASQQSAWARRWRDLLSEVLSDLGHDGLSEGQRQLARRAATIAIACEKMEGDAAQGREINLQTYGELTDRLGRCFTRLGLKKRHAMRDVTPPSVEQYLAHVTKQSEAAS